MDPMLQQPLAASSDGPIVATASASCRQLAHHRLVYQIQVINVAIKKVITWTLSGTAATQGPAGLAASADGRSIGLVTPTAPGPASRS
ncbi:MAG TPA: hypothetical protein VF979_07895 [Streptosporangiaceae bacterium]